MNSDTRSGSSSTYLHDVIAIAESDYKDVLQNIEHRRKIREEESGKFLHSLDGVFVENDAECSDKSNDRLKTSTATRRGDGAKLALKQADAILRIYEDACRAVAVSTQIISAADEDDDHRSFLRETWDNDREHLRKVLRAGMRVVERQRFQTAGRERSVDGCGEEQKEDIGNQARAAFGSTEDQEKKRKSTNEKLLLQSVRKGVRKMTDGLSFAEDDMWMS